MKLSVIALCLCGFAAAVCNAYEQRIVHVVEQVRELHDVGGAAVGYAGSPHDFYLLYEYCTRASTDADLIEMLHDSAPAVRIMGAKCILKAPYRHLEPGVVNTLIGDPQTLLVGPGGCVFTEMTVDAVVRELKRNPDFLGPFMSEAANASPANTPRFGSFRVPHRDGPVFSEAARAFGYPGAKTVDELGALLGAEWRGRQRLEAQVFLRRVSARAGSLPVTHSINAGRGDELSLTQVSSLLGIPQETIAVAFEYENGRVSAVGCSRHEP